MHYLVSTIYQRDMSHAQDDYYYAGPKANLRKFSTFVVAVGRASHRRRMVFGPFLSTELWLRRPRPCLLHTRCMGLFGSTTLPPAATDPGTDECIRRVKFGSNATGPRRAPSAVHTPFWSGTNIRFGSLADTQIPENCEMAGFRA